MIRLQKHAIAALHPCPAPMASRRRWRARLAGAALACALAPSGMAQQAPRPAGMAYELPRPWGPPAAVTVAQALRTVPASLPGYRRHVFYLPARPDEDRLEVELFGGKVVQADNCNPPSLQGRFEPHSLRGVGHMYWVLQSDGEVITTAMGCAPAPAPGLTFAAVPSGRIRYNSRSPLVVFIPEPLALRYRVLTLGPLQPVPAR